MCRRKRSPSPWPACAPRIEPGHVGDDEAAIVAQRDDAEIGRQRRERVVGDLRTRGGDARDQGGLAGVRKADQTDVGEQLQLQAQESLFAGLARFGPPRRAVGGRHELRVAAPAASSFRDQDPLAFFGEIGEQLQAGSTAPLSRRDLLEHQRADRHVDLEIVRALAGLVRALAVLAALALRTPDGSGSR